MSATSSSTPWTRAPSSSSPGLHCSAWLSGELCDAVLQRSGSAEDLRRLSRSNMLLAPLDTKDHEFHMHTLLSEMLQSELHRVNAGEEAALHRRASDWYMEQGDADQSVEHAIASGDVALAGERIWAVAAAYVTEGRRATLRSWTQSFTDEQLASVPALGATMALTALSAGDGEEMQHWAGLAQGRMSQLPGEPDQSQAAACEMVRLSGNTNDGLAAVADGFGALHLVLPADSPGVHMPASSREPSSTFSATGTAPACCSRRAASSGPRRWCRPTVTDSWR